jgi:16S rRNA (guanine966-N2)-methyltransferase
VRIVAGRHKGRRLAAPAEGGLDGARVVEAFAGTGALGLEALSHGAAHASFIENHPASLAALKANVEALGEAGRASILRADATRPPPAEAPCSLAFLDPPYHSGLAGPCLAALAERGWLSEGALAVVEVAAREDFAAPAGFEVEDERRYGAARLVFLRYRPA